MFLTIDTKKTFIELKQTFVKALILNYFDLKHYIQIEMDTLSYTISKIFSQLTSDNLSRCHLIAFFFRKMIQTKTWYETYDGELLTIIEAFKTWKCYLKVCKHELFMLMNYNNFQHFMDTKNLSFRQV